MPAKNERVCDVLCLNPEAKAWAQKWQRCLWATSNHEPCTKGKPYQMVQDFILQTDAHPQPVVKYSTSWSDYPSPGMSRATCDHRKSVAGSFKLHKPRWISIVISANSKFLRCKQPSWSTNLDHSLMSWSFCIPSVPRFLDEMIFNCMRMWMWKSIIGL